MVDSNTRGTSDTPIVKVIKEKTVLIITILCLLLVALFVGLKQDLVVATLNHYKLLPQPESVVELYFTQPNSLPATYTPGKIITTAFTVHNASQQAATYDYVVSAQPENGSAEVIQRGSVTLGPEEAKSTDIALTTKDYGKRVKYFIQIPAQSQYINFWTTRK